MKNMWRMMLAVVLVAGMWTTVQAGPTDDYKVIKKAKTTGSSATVSEARWFKVEVRDTETDKVKVKVTIPVSLLDVVATWCPDGKLKVDNETNMEIDLRQLVNELKKVGPMAYIEVYEDNETVKVWVE